MTNYSARDMSDLRQQFGGKCVECHAPHSIIRGKIAPLEFAHKPGFEIGFNGRGSNARFLEIRSHPERFLLLCFKCHRGYDQKGQREQRRAAGESGAR